MGILDQLSWKDLVDILFVAFLIYRGILIIHGTRAVQMLTGLGILVGLFWVGHLFKLYSLNWILNHFFESFFIIIIILFQDHFRNALAFFGTGKKIFGLFPRGAQDETMINEVIEAVGALSREKVGALIILERNQGLANYLATGTTIESNVHSDLIYAIFQSRSSLHDGAIILGNSKIMGAGCFMPLTRKVEIDKHLGTRHRAALGISEDTDAIAIVVSEETGKISLAFRGQFYHCSKPKELRERIQILTSGNLDEHSIQVKGL